MSEFDAFGEATDEQPPVVEEDPAADFLAREQDELKGLEDDNFGETPDIQINQEQQQGDDFDPFTSGQSGGSPQPDGDFFGGEPVQDPTGEEDGEPVTNGPIDGYSAIGQVDRQRAEPEQIRIWREENARRIEKKDAEEAKRKEEWRNIAKKELEDWYKHHDEQLSKTKENNRNRTNNQPASEAAFIEDRDQTQPGEEWEKICRLCEFNPKNSKNTKDISRMRQILLQLKQTPLVR